MTKPIVSILTNKAAPILAFALLVFSGASLRAEGYVPVNTKFWTGAGAALAEGNYQKVLKLAEIEEDSDRVSDGSLALAEVELVRARALNDLGLSFAATTFLSEILLSKAGT